MPFVVHPSFAQRTRSCAVALITLIAGCVVLARAQDPVYPWVTFVGTCQGSTMELVLTGEDDGQHPEVTGFDIVRRTHGACGDEWVRITADPIPRVFGEAFDLRCTDPSAADGALYYYQVFGVDAQRTARTDLYTLYWMPGSNDATFAGCGHTLAGHGTLTDDGGWWLFEPCPGTCFPSVWVEQWLDTLEPFVGTGVALALYGGFGWTIEGHLMIVEDFEIQPCTTAAQPSTWSKAKQIYR